MEELLTYQSVEICFNGETVIRDVSFALHPGEILCIAGESGSGKSSLLKAALGLLGNEGLVTKGDIWFQGLDLPDLKEREFRPIRGAKIGMIFQDPTASFCPIRRRYLFTGDCRIFKGTAAKLYDTKEVLFDGPDAPEF